jgi:hypothetical protein
VDWIEQFILFLCLVDIRQDRIIYCNDNNTLVLFNVWSIDYNIYFNQKKIIYFVFNIINKYFLEKHY